VTGPRGAGIAAALLLHAAGAAVLLTYEPARKALLAAAPIMVSLVPPQAEPPKPEQKPVEPPKPRPVVKRPPPVPQPVITAPAEAPSPVTAPPPPSVIAPAPPPEPAPAPVAAKPAPVAVTPPVFDADYLLNPAPEYPRLARRMGEEGRVILRVLVSAGGAAEEVQIRTSSGHARLDDVARETVRRWKFVPAKRGSEAVAAWVLVPISFRLEG
jgi:protein TonB